VLVDVEVPDAEVDVAVTVGVAVKLGVAVRVAEGV
jgi:hypothetical protein